MTHLGTHRWVEEEIELEPIRKLSARRGWVVSTTLRPLYPRQTPSTHCTGGWVSLGGPIWTAAEKFAPTRIRFLGRPARNMNYAVPPALH
jgi:hypothetical protein